MDFQYYIKVLEQAGVVFTSGLTIEEIRKLEKGYGFTFPPDLRSFLMFALPISKGFLNWRQASHQEIVEKLSWPYEGMCFDIENNSFWLKEWGPQPEILEDALAIAKKVLAQAPTLIPINGHRYLPDKPYEEGNPVFSVYQTDIIYYGCNLANYLENEFNYFFGQTDFNLNHKIKQIEFWSQFAEGLV